MLDQILTVAVVLLPTLFAVAIEAVSKEIKEHPVWRVAVIAFGLGLSALTWVQISRANKSAEVDRNKAIVETSERVSAKVSESVSQSVSKSVGEQYQQTINRLQTQIGLLQGQLKAQGRSVEAIRGSKVVSGKEPLKVEVTNPSSISAESKLDVHVSAMPVNSDKTRGKYARQFILTTNKRMQGAHATVTCDHKINSGGATISGAGTVMGNGQMNGDNSFSAGIGMPDWSPDGPLVITVFFDEDDLGNCRFTVP